MSAPNPACADCGGTGAIPAEYNPPHPPTFRRCDCVLKYDIIENVEKGLVGLSRCPVIPATPLDGKEKTNLWITSGDEFLAHLRHVAIRKPITWGFRVNSDAEMVTAWLATIAVSGQEIFDADAYTVSTRFMTLPDMVVPPDLLVVRMGVKIARNAAANEVLMEALQLRMHEGKPTWVWDEPHNPLGPGHLFWSDALGRILPRWERVRNLDAPEIVPKRGKLPRESTEPKKVTLRRTLPREVLESSTPEEPILQEALPEPTTITPPRPPGKKRSLRGGS